MWIGSRYRSGGAAPQMPQLTDLLHWLLVRLAVYLSAAIISAGVFVAGAAIYAYFIAPPIPHQEAPASSPRSFGPPPDRPSEKGVPVKDDGPLVLDDKPLRSGGNLGPVATSSDQPRGQPLTSVVMRRQVALVVGNSAYEYSMELTSPKNDAQKISDELRTLGFEVQLISDVTKQQFESALSQFARTAQNADSALFFYAGHAMQYQETNYLLPVDARLKDEASIRSETISVDDIRSTLERTNGPKILILDACRSNSQLERLARRNPGAFSTRGLARMNTTEDMVVAYSSEPDQSALDGAGSSSPFTTALVKRLKEPDTDIETVFGQVRADVMAQTGGRQQPEFHFSLLNDYYINSSSRIAWERAAKLDTSDAYVDFLTNFPSSAFADLARQRLESLASGKSAPVTPNK
jgi:hypothetical protein